MARERKRSRSSSTKSHHNGAGAGGGGGAAGGAGGGGGEGGGGARAISKLEFGGRVYFRLREEYLAACERNDERRKEILTDLMKYASNFHVSLDEQIMLLMLPLLKEGLLNSSFAESIDSLEGTEHAVGLYQLLRESIDRFLHEGHCLMSDLCSYLDRWDPDLKAVAKAAKAFGSLARLLCWDEMVELFNKLEAASLEGNSPIEICGPFWKARGLYEKFRFKLYLLMTLEVRLMDFPHENWIRKAAACASLRLP